MTKKTRMSHKRNRLKCLNWRYVFFFYSKFQIFQNNLTNLTNAAQELDNLLLEIKEDI